MQPRAELAAAESIFDIDGENYGIPSSASNQVNQTGALHLYTVQYTTVYTTKRGPLACASCKGPETPTISLPDLTSV